MQEREAEGAIANKANGEPSKLVETSPGLRELPMNPMSAGKPLPIPLRPQLRHLLDSYHLGTNRVVFFIQPRPNVLQQPSGIVGDSPRPIEGIQEFFLIVNQPKNTP